MSSECNIFDPPVHELDSFWGKFDLESAVAGGVSRMLSWSLKSKEQEVCKREAHKFKVEESSSS
ncbi:hypothetical protein N7509_011132 [Penicillium cosmopolitanum]|uniref:Uncharacterized protein n=1 Tax=Penicillium cosmopolitanum TaxID=1131564 RepID=A0A9W9VSM3_9EURO|nr:uncharacterized protein N7509_011132 [Penicillium cosmopolitanum]KAJ5388591.1 hypothetical protein N7509_011132 [Penicillium cosmopolitanum]